MRERQSRWLFCINLLSALLLLCAATVSATVDKVICVPWQGDTSKQHTALSGVPVQLKGVIKTNDTSPVYYKWVFGDGSADSAPVTLSGSTKYNVEATHTYSAASNTPFTAQLQVSNSSPFALALEDPYLVKLEDTTLDTQINLAIDKGLWWLYKQGGNHGNSSYPHTYDGSPQMTWLQTSSVYTLVTPTASAIHAFGINGHKIKGDPDQDPYVEAVQQGMNYLVKGYNYYTNYPALSAYTIAVEHSPDNPDSNNNGFGVQVYDWGGSNVPYQNGQIMDAIIASGVAPTDFTGRDFSHKDAVVTHNWTYRELLQDMTDMQAWGQNDGGTCNGGICGSWWYGWNYGSPGDNSASQWSAIGMLAAEHPPWSVTVPQWVKDYNANWLQYSQFHYNGNPNHVAFSYNYTGGCAGDACLQTTTSGMVQMIFDGQTTSDPKWGPAQKYVADNWYNFTHQGSTWGPAKTYGWYSFAKAMRLSLPSATTQLVKSSGASFDWYYGNPANASCGSESSCEKGLAARIVETQSSDGSWQNGNLTNPPLTTAWMIITLKPTLFEASPIACFTAAPSPSYANQPISFNPSCSSHSEPGKGLANLTKFEWDWNNDGTFDASSGDPTVQSHSFACPVLPCFYPVKLQVTDDSDPVRTAAAVVTIEITNPPHPPVAKPGGPYLASTCPNDSLTLNGAASFDQDQGQHETGCSTCPNDTITAWAWDLKAPLDFSAVNATGSKPVLSPAIITTFFGVGTQDVGLRVTDNTLLAYPGSGQQNLTNAAFTPVEIKQGCICNLAARPKIDKVQLTWTHIGAPSYDIYRSAEGPNSGFTRIAHNVVTSYATYLDPGLTIGKDYWYRVVSTGGNCVGGSNSAYAKPNGR